MKLRQAGFIIALLFFSVSIYAQTPKEFNPVWSSKLNSTKYFIKNEGQFNVLEKKDNILYGFCGNTEKFFLTKNGIIIRIDKITQKNNPLIFIKKVFAGEEERKEEEKENMKVNTYYLYAEWENTNPNTEIKEINKSEGYFTFDRLSFIADGYKKILYKNIYEGIDIEYIIPSDSCGIKYNLIVHPGADISKAKLHYSGDIKSMKLNMDGNIVIQTPAWDIIEHSPKSFYSDNKSIISNFELKNNTINFNIPDKIDENNVLVIDPWVSSLTISGNDIGYDVDYDYSSNLYVFIRPVGQSVIYVNKYSPAGTLLWSHLSTYDFSSYEGNMIVEKSTDRVYIGEGFNASGARVYRLGSNGIADGYVSVQDGNYREIWDMGFDCSANRILAFGGGTSSNMNGGQIDINTGVISVANFTGVGGICQDIVSYAINNQGRVYVVFAKSSDGASSATNDQLMLVNNTLNGNTWMVPHGMYGFSEVSNHWPNLSIFASTSNGFNCLTVNDNYLYYYDGGGLAVFNPANGASLTATSVGLSGTWYTPLNQGGIAVDDCDHVYIGGSSNNILMYNFNGTALTQAGSIPLGWASGQVFDIKYDRNTNLLFVSGNHNVGVYNAPLSTTCNLILDTTFCNAANSGTATVTLNTPASNPLVSYLWQDLGGTTISQTLNSSSLTNSVTGLANGSYIVSVQLNAPCGPLFIDTVTVDCPTCGVSITTTPVSCFGGNNGTATATPATTSVPPFTYVWTPNPPVGQGTNAVSGLSAVTYTVSVTDSNACGSTANCTITQPTAVNPQVVTITDVTCYGGSDGSITVSTTGGTPPYTYLWNNLQIDSIAVNLSANTYSVVVTDANGCTATQSATVNQPPQLVISATATPNAICYGDTSVLTANNASTYIWSPSTGLSSTSGTQVNAYPVTTTTYVVIGTNAAGCTASTQVTVTVNPLPIINITGTTPICSGQSSVLTAHGGVSYIWNPSATGDNITVSPLIQTIYYVTGTDANGCENTAQFTVNVVQMPVANAGNDAAVCSLTYQMNAIPSVGTGTWTGSGPGSVMFSDIYSPTAILTVSANGIYTLIWTENNGNNCINSDTVTVQLTQIPTSDFTVNNIPCFGGTTTVTYTGTGTSQYQFMWNYGGGIAVPGNGTGPHTLSYQFAGTYQVSLTVS
ncbi:MAG: hypothetical protein HY958_12850, partial [Bacteroidia bacterium]|nr:hypothetical protein [Bacteroidia bacterium]